MKKRLLAGTDIEVSALAYGMADFGTQVPTEAGLALIERYLEAGGNFIDTAHCYSFWAPNGWGASEAFVGEAVWRFGRERLVIATKGGHVGMDGYPRPDAFANPELVRQDLTESLDRLELPSVDIYYLHRDDTRVPAEELIEAANEHVASGRTRALGASNWSAARLAQANSYALAKRLQPFVILQNQWSLAEPDWTDLDAPGAVRFVLSSEEALLVELGIPVAAWSPTANGFFATNGVRSGPYGGVAGRERLARANELAAAKGVTPNQIALAFLLCHPVTTIPILGTSSAEHLEDALGAVSVELSAEDLTFLTTGKR